MELGQVYILNGLGHQEHTRSPAQFSREPISIAILIEIGDDYVVLEDYHSHHNRAHTVKDDLDHYYDLNKVIELIETQLKILMVGEVMFIEEDGKLVTLTKGLL